MIFFSELYHKRVYTESGRYVGKLHDLIFMPQDKPIVTKIVVKHIQEIIIPLSYLRNMNGKIVVATHYQSAPLTENEMYVNRNIIDQQIIDIQGNKVVRVNDILIQTSRSGWNISGVDTSARSVFRWFGLESIISNIAQKLHMPYSVNVLSWTEIQPLELARGKLQLKMEQEKLKKVRPEDLADYLEKTNVRSIRKILGTLDEEYAASVINSLNLTYQTELFREFEPARAARVIAMIDPDEAVDILLAMSAKRRDEITTLLPETKRKEIEHLLMHARTPIGELMTTEYLAVSPKDTVSQIMLKIRGTSSHFEQLNYVYVLNDSKALVGVCNLHELMMQPSEMPIYKFMVTNVILLHLHTPEEIAIKRMLKYKIYALPVVDSKNHLLGILTMDDIAEFIVNSLA